MKAVFQRYSALRQKTWFRWATDLLFVAVIFTGASLWQTRHHVRSGTPVTFDLPSLNGQQISSTSLHGKPTLLVFWAPWCGVCQAESSNVSRVRSWLGSRANVLSIATAFDDPRQVDAYVSRNAVDYPVLLASDGLPRELHVESFPTLYFLDSEGRVKGSVVGYTTSLGLLVRLLL